MKSNKEIKEVMYKDIISRIEQAESQETFTEPEFGYIIGLIDYHSHLEENKQIISGLKERLNNI